jgi:DNA polymerase-3 subunit delta'
MPFGHILAQDQVITLLRKSICDAQVSHAYLFFGPDGVGKRTVALAFAKALNCLSPEAQATGDFCGQCHACRLITVGNHPDVRLLTPETTGGKTVIPIDAIRTKIGEAQAHPLPLREDAQLKPLDGRTKVYIIDPANRPGLQEDAGNALLLTLEEPPPHVAIILISARPTAMLPTLVSRCQPVRFRLAPREAIREALLALGTLEEPQVVAIEGMAAGRLGWALAVAANPGVLEARRLVLEELAQLLPSGRLGALRLAETLHTLAAGTDNGEVEEGKGDGKGRMSTDRVSRRNLPELLDVVASWWRDLLVCQLGQSHMRINADFSDTLERHVGRFTPAQLRDALAVTMRAKRLIERNANIDLTLERMCMQVLGGSAGEGLR